MTRYDYAVLAFYFGFMLVISWVFRRFITNEVVRCATDTNNVTTCITNRPWSGITDSSNQVSGYSARGNVGIA